ncbi:MAG: SMC-Scp complex subunit ScpB [Candidatus Pacebacteria bacterium]|nr:SMC-Scp complex subunit ScpB [Candidatus Paceibacterota bacterium]
MENKNLEAIIEGILFAHGEAVSLEKIAKTAKKNESEIKNSLKNLEEKYKDKNSGISLLYQKDKIKLISAPEVGSYIEKMIKEDFDENLTPATLETLTIAVYLAPISRAEIDFIRGVNSGFMLRALLMRGLLERRPDPKRPYIYLYEPTFNLLQYLGIKKVEDLPEYEKYHNILKSHEENVEKKDVL